MIYMYKLPVWLRSPGTTEVPYVRQSHKTGLSVKVTSTGPQCTSSILVDKPVAWLAPHGSWLAPSPVGTLYFHWLNIVGNICFP